MCNKRTVVSNVILPSKLDSKVYQKKFFFNKSMLLKCVGNRIIKISLFRYISSDLCYKLYRYSNPFMSRQKEGFVYEETLNTWCTFSTRSDHSVIWTKIFILLKSFFPSVLTWNFQYTFVISTFSMVDIILVNSGIVLLWFNLNWQLKYHAAACSLHPAWWGSRIRNT